jgi:biopolymer transport protein ExbB/TolQ
MELKVFAPVDKPLQEFQTPAEYDAFYQKNKGEIDHPEHPITTHMLNKMYKIDGYRITRIHGEMAVKKFIKNYYQKRKESSIEERLSTQEQCHELMNDEFGKLEDRMEEHENWLKTLEKKLGKSGEDERIMMTMKDLRRLQKEVDDLRDLQKEVEDLKRSVDGFKKLKEDFSGFKRLQKDFDDLAYLLEKEKRIKVREPQETDDDGY